jgi:hypothetical protein
MSGFTRRSSRSLGLAACLFMAACGGSTEPEPATPLARSSAHFDFESTTAEATAAEMDAGIELAEAQYEDIAVLVGANHLPGRKIKIILEGPYRSDRSGAYIDEQGGVHLSRYRADLGGYFGSMAHEIVHAFRYSYWHRFNVGPWKNFGFIEEGFAEFVAQQVYPEKGGFPFYLHPEDVVVGHMLIRGDAIPMQVMRDRHDLNTPCEWQTYPLRASWFRYVDETYGRAAVLAIAYAEVETTNEMIEGLLGTPMAQVDAGWNQWLRARYAAIPNADALAQAYLARFGDQHFCQAGVDY